MQVSNLHLQFAFQISVTTDIRFYGLLKTIGTTDRQIRRIVCNQALLLSILGIPLGLVVGYGIGTQITPLIIVNLHGLSAKDLSFSPWIFILSALFSLFTVLISCRKPAHIAAKISAVAAVRYTEGSALHHKKERRTRGAKIIHMAWANLGRNRKKTMLTLMPIAVIFPIFLFLGIIVPLISYQIMGRQSIVDRIRQAD